MLYSISHRSSVFNSPFNIDVFTSTHSNTNSNNSSFNHPFKISDLFDHPKKTHEKNFKFLFNFSVPIKIFVPLNFPIKFFPSTFPIKFVLNFFIFVLIPPLKALLKKTFCYFIWNRNYFRLFIHKSQLLFPRLFV
uniref:Uncharacterized protein n=1 Tax=Meloidogyne enterolobii TaxID=390850 RepID=A0A6V7YBY5_MELEN|nr:unnamed protein product [Meloidogyne enterolobii]